MNRRTEPPVRPVVRHELVAEDFPFTIQMRCERTEELLWEYVCEGPGPIEVPGFWPRRVSVTLIESNGSASTLFSNGVESAP